MNKLKDLSFMTRTAMMLSGTRRATMMLLVMLFTAVMATTATAQTITITMETLTYDEDGTTPMSPEKGGTAVIRTGEYPEDTYTSPCSCDIRNAPNVHVAAIPNLGFRFMKWLVSGDGSNLEYMNESSQKEVTISSVSADVTLTAVFIALRKNGYCGVDDPATGNVYEDENVMWTFDPSTTTLTISGTGAMADYDSQNMPWFDNKEYITNVIIENGVTSIGESAFKDFGKLESVTIPSSVTSIEDNAFNGCSGLTSITIPASVTSIGSLAFRGCNNLSIVFVQRYNSSEESPITTLGADAFDGCDATIYVPNDAACTAYKGATNWNQYTNKIHSISEGNNSGYCGDSHSNNGKNVYYAYYQKDINEVVLIIAGSGTMKNFVSTSDLPWSGFKDKIKSVNIGDGVTSIGSNAFYGCSNLPSIAIPASVTSIGLCAFENCSSLTSIAIPASVTSIGERAFWNCQKLTSFTIPASVTSIYGNTFNGCEKLESINVDDNNQNYASEDGVLFNKDKTTLIRYPQGKSGTSYNIPASVTSIEDHVFNGCSGLTSITIPASVTSIGSDAFKNTGWYNNQSDGLLYLNNWLLGYKGSKPTGTLQINEGTKGIGGDAFNGCSGLTSLTIPSSVTSIGDYAFYGCNGLTSITIPNSVTSIGEYSFNHCNKLENVYCFADPTKLTWGYAEGDFITSSDPNYPTKCHVFDASTWTTNFGGNVNVQFVDDLGDIAYAALWNADSEHDGTTADRAYIITTTEGLDLLAQRVNDGEFFSGKFFKLGADITYSHKAANEEGADTENNYTAIGLYSSYKPFSGTFDGDGHTVSGIRIYKVNDYNQGLFGYVLGGTVKNVTLSDARITGMDNVGGIVGRLSNTSNAIENCLVIGTIVNCYDPGNPPIGGAIVGYGGSDNTLKNNYYSDCTVGGATSGIGVGCDGSNINCHDVNTYKGAVQGTLHTLTLGENITAKGIIVNQSGILSVVDGTTVTIDAQAGYTLTSASYNDGTDHVITAVNDVYSFTMPASNITVSATYTTIPWSGTGTSTDPYIISYPSQLDLLATNVNGGTTYSGKYFKLGANIAYTHTTDWNDATSTENNYTPIGCKINANEFHPFSGTFDGDGHTISGIRIYKGSNNTITDCEQGIFGRINQGAVKNLTLADARITGFESVGGIVGWGHYNSSEYPTVIENCHVLSNVAIHAVQSNADNHGGIVGYYSTGATISLCSSAATLTLGSGASGSGYGGIVGTCAGATLRNNLAIGSTVPAVTNAGAILGYLQSGTTEYNYYSNCTVGTKTSGIGCNTADIEDNDGAVEATILSDAATSLPALTAGTKVAFRREFTGGKASTVCLPFGIDATQAAAAGKFFTFVGVDKSNPNDWIVTMQEEDPSNRVSGDLTANTPYLFKPTATGPVLFHGTADYDDTNLTTTDTEGWKFTGTYEKKTWASGQTRLYGFAAADFKKADGTLLNDVGSFQRYAWGYCDAFRCYLWAPDPNAARGVNEAGNALPESMKVRIVSASGETTVIGTLDTRTGDVTFDGEAWYSLDGSRLSGKPTKKGLYINNGKKVVVK